jgi:hypothetical protein
MTTYNITVTYSDQPDLKIDMMGFTWFDFITIVADSPEEAEELVWTDYVASNHREFVKSIDAVEVV